MGQNIRNPSQHSPVQFNRNKRHGRLNTEHYNAHERVFTAGLHSLYSGVFNKLATDYIICSYYINTAQYDKSHYCYGNSQSLVVQVGLKHPTLTSNQQKDAGWRYIVSI